MRWVLPLAFVVAATAPAHADEVAKQYYPQASLGPGIGMWIGDVGALAATGPTLQIAGDIRVMRTLQLRAMYEHAWLFATAGNRDEMAERDVTANLDGFALLLHHPIFAFDPASDFRMGGDAHVLAGVEVTRLAWDGMPAFFRPEAVFGFGCSLVVHDKQTHTRKLQQIDFGLRIQIARAPEPGLSPFVAPARTLPFDRSLIMELSWRFAR